MQAVCHFNDGLRDLIFPQCPKESRSVGKIESTTKIKGQAEGPREGIGLLASV